MKKWWFCVCSLFVTHFLAAAPFQPMPSQFAGEWEAVYCGWWDDSTTRGTYNFSFSPTGGIHTYLQYYSDRQGACITRSGIASLANGQYQVVSTEMREGKVSYVLQVQYTHLSSPLSHRVILISPNEIQVCMQPSLASCRAYRRR